MNLPDLSFLADARWRVPEQNSRSHSVRHTMVTGLAAEGENIGADMIPRRQHLCEIWAGPRSQPPGNSLCTAPRHLAVFQIKHITNRNRVLGNW